jgi:translation initiation factor 1
MGGLGAILAAKGLSFGGDDAMPADDALGEEQARSSDAVWEWSSISKLVLQHERKGRGGKTVTTLRGVPADAHEQVVRLLRKAMGVGVRSEGDVLVVQGDQRDRLRQMLTERGVRRVIG